MEANPVIALYLALGIIIAAARGAGATARRLNQPRVLGELLVGVVLGPTVLDIVHASFVHDVHLLQETIVELAELGVLLLMFKIGLEVHFNELMQVGGVAVVAGVIGALLPVAMTMPLVMAFNYEWQSALFAGVILAATSVSISAQVLLELNVLQTKVGNGLLATALIDDVIAILLVSLTVAITGPENKVDASALGEIVLRMGTYIMVAFLIAWFVLPRLTDWLTSHPKDSEAYGVAAFALVMALLFGWSAEAFGGVAAITGAFIAGMGLSRSNARAKREIETAVNNIAYAFLVPVFFVSVGLQINLSTFEMDAVPFTALLLGVAVVSKIGGCGIGARFGGFNNKESFQLGMCMVSRGEVGLIIMSIGLTSGILDKTDTIFSVLFMVILLTTVFTPPLVRIAFTALEPVSDENSEHKLEMEGSSNA